MCMNVRVSKDDQRLEKHLCHVRSWGHKDETLVPTLKESTVQPSSSHPRYTESAT